MYEEIAYASRALDRWGDNEEMGTLKMGSSTTYSNCQWDAVRLKVRSLVGLLPLCASTVSKPA